MIELTIDKSYLDGIYGMSCIENYFLYVLKANRYPFQYLYYNSFLSFGEIVCAFVNKEMRYEYFDKIPRLQNVALNNSLIQMNVYKQKEFSSLLFDCDYNFVQIKSDYVNKKYNKQFWRNDHYILLAPSNETNFVYLNDNPRDHGNISLNELKYAYDGTVIGINILSDINEELKTTFLKDFKNSVITSDICRIDDLDICDIYSARDILGVHRIVQKRICEFCSLYENMCLCAEHIIELDKYYSAIEYMRMRNRVDYDKIRKNFRDVLKKDDEIRQQLINKVEVYYRGK